MDFSISFYAYLFVFLLIPCFSSICAHTCNKSIIINPHFYSNEPNDKSCDSFVFNISVNFYNYSNFFYFRKTLSTYKCDSTSNAKDYFQHEKFHDGCSSSSPKNVSVEWTLSFTNESGELTSELARFTSFLSDCSDPGPKSRGKDTLKTTLIIIAAVSGGLVIIFIIIASCFCILYFKHKKWKWVSDSSKLLINSDRDLSDPYKNDLELVGSQYTHIFTYEELKEATDAFNPKNELGGGGFGIVYKGKLRDGKIVAVKRLFKNSYKRVEQFMNEVEILSNLHHPNLVTLYGCTACTGHELLLVYEYVPNGTVADHLHGPHVGDHSLTWPLRLNIAIETAQALTFLHSIEPQIIHRDVKTNNILLDEGFHVKVGDFGLSRLVPLDMTHVSTMPQGTPGYVDPVFHQCYQLTEKSDVYSFGVVLIELISSKPAVDMSRSSYEINLADLALNKIQRSELSELVDPNFEYEKDREMRRMASLVAELAFRCLQGEREMRPTIKEALEVLLVVQKEGFGNKNKRDKDNNGEKVKEESETCLLRDGFVYSPDTVVERWMSRNMASNTSV